MGRPRVTVWVEAPHGELFLAASFDRALAGLYPNRYDLAADDLEGQRESIAHRAATELQGFTLLQRLDDGLFNPDHEDEPLLQALFEDRAEPASLLAWSWEPGERLPLILTSAAVALRGLPRPRGAGVEVIDSTSAWRLLRSLHRLDVIRVGLL